MDTEITFSATVQRNKRMKRVAAVSLVVLLTAVYLYAGGHREFQTGKLLDVSFDERLLEGTTKRYAVYHVQIGDVVYLGVGVNGLGGAPATPAMAC
jgi:hypothetical protein